MADTDELSGTTTVTTLLSTDYLRGLVPAAGVAASSKITLANLQAAITALVNLTDMVIAPYQVRTTATFSKTSDTALANVPGLSVNLLAGKNYRITARLYTTSNAAGGTKAALSGTVTPSAIVYSGVVFSPSNIIQTQATALGTAVGPLTGGTTNLYEITGLISVSVGGTLTVQFAQNASNGTASTVVIGSTLCVENIA